MGCKEQRASKIATHFFLSIKTCCVYEEYLPVFDIHTFTLYLSRSLKRYHIHRPKMGQDIFYSLMLVTNSKTLIILLGGTSGSGKSTHASLLSARLGIQTMLSTDSVRHFLRNFILEKD